MCSSTCLDVRGLPFGFSFLTIPIYLNWVNHQVTDLSVSASVPHVCEKLSWKVRTDLNLAYHSTYREYHHAANNALIIRC
jgi:hypothetical protein